MQKTIRLLAAIAALGFSGAVLAADTEIRAAQIVSYGIFNVDYVKRNASGYSDRAPAAHHVENESVRFTEYTDKIPGELGIHFGYEYVINSSPKGGRMVVTEVIRFPKGGIKRPNGRRYQESRDRTAIEIGHPNIYGWVFDYDWEIVPGEWTFEVWYKDARIVRKTFHVEEPSHAKKSSGQETNASTGE